MPERDRTLAPAAPAVQRCTADSVVFTGGSRDAFDVAVTGMLRQIGIEADHIAARIHRTAAAS